MQLHLPHTSGCLVCGRDNPCGLHLNFSVEDGTGIVRAEFTPGKHHIGFTGIAHGGILATVFDEAMVWAATWSGKRFCVCGELTVRFRHAAEVAKKLVIEAKIVNARPRLIQTSATAIDGEGRVIAEAGGKYVPMTQERHGEMIATVVDESDTAVAAGMLGAPHRA
jgi:acyl-coenzyme A thioesterase PaaI-like protein